MVSRSVPGLDGVTAARRLNEAHPHVAVLTMMDDDGSILEAIRAGAAGYILTLAPAGGSDTCGIRGLIWSGQWTRA